METKLRLGDKCLLYDGESAKTTSSFKGYYIGFKEIKTPWYLAKEDPEGHLFVRRDEDSKIEIYEAVKGNPLLGEKRPGELKFMFYSDGCDGPEWPAGFPVEKIEVNLTNLEKEFLEKRLDNYEMKGDNVAA